MNDHSQSARPDDGPVVERFLRSRTDADFRVLYRRHTPALYGFAWRLTGGSGDAVSDVVQETSTRLEY